MLNKTSLKTAIKDAFNTVKDQPDNQDQAIETLSDLLADSIDEYVKSASIKASVAAIAGAAMSNGGGPVVAANDLICTIS